MQTQRLVGWGVFFFLAIVAGFLTMPQGVHAAAGCAPYASKQCISNIAYWYDSCGVLQDLARNCNLTNQACQAGTCVNKQPSYTVTHYAKSCYNNDLYWFNSAGRPTGIAKSCQDQNSCTVDTCTSNKCSHELRCDGSTCAANSADFATYCSGQTQTPGQGETNQGQSQGQTSSKPLAISFFAKKDSDPMQWQKSVTAGNNEKIYFLITVKNTSPQPFNDVMVSTTLPQGVSYTNDLKIDDAPYSGSVSSGIDIGTLNPQSARSITFTGLAQPGAQNISLVSQATSGSSADSDSLTVNSSVPAGAAQSTTATSTSSPFLDFIKKWYAWIIIIAVLVILFIVIFRRLSSGE